MAVFNSSSPEHSKILDDLQKKLKFKKLIIALMNEKGGVGKTTASVVLAEYLSIVLGLRVCMIDIEIQCSLSCALIDMESLDGTEGNYIPPIHPEYDESDPSWNTVNPRSSIADIFFGKAVVPYKTSINQENGYKGSIDLLCGDSLALEKVNNAYTNENNEIVQKVHNRLRDFLQDPDVQELYDVFIIDTGPSRQPLYHAALRAASHIIIPFIPEEKSKNGVTAMLQTWTQEKYQRENEQEDVDLIGILPNQVQRTKVHAHVIDEFSSKYKKYLFPESAWFSRLTAFPERDIAGSNPKSIFELPDREKAKIQAMEFGNYVTQKILGETEECQQHELSQ